MANAWTQDQREAARKFVGETMPNNASILVNNIEDIMPPNFRRAFEQLFASVTPSTVWQLAELAADWWVLWSGEHQQWWGPQERGYTTHLMHAGIYTREDAEEIAARPAIGRRANEAMSFTAAIERTEATARVESSGK